MPETDHQETEVTPTPAHTEYDYSPTSPQYCVDNEPSQSVESSRKRRATQIDKVMSPREQYAREQEPETRLHSVQAPNEPGVTTSSSGIPGHTQGQSNSVSHQQHGHSSHRYRQHKNNQHPAPRGRRQPRPAKQPVSEPSPISHQYNWYLPSVYHTKPAEVRLKRILHIGHITTSWHPRYERTVLLNIHTSFCETVDGEAVWVTAVSRDIKAEQYETCFLSQSGHMHRALGYAALVAHMRLTDRTSTV